MTIKEIAAIAGVSISTVSKIINGKDANLNPQTRERVLKIVKEYNFTPYAAIKNQTSRKNFIIGLLLDRVDEFSPFIAGCLRCAQQNGYSLLLYSSDHDPEQELKNITSLCQKKADGVIWEPVSSDSLPMEKHFKDANIETMCIQCAAEGAENIDFKEMGFRATMELVKLGHSKIGCLTGKDPYLSDQIAEGFKQCLFEQSIPFTKDMILSPDDNPVQTRSILNRFTGILSADYTAAVRLYGILSRLKIQIPYELSLLSFAEYPTGSLDFPKISTIAIPYYEFGIYLCDKLIRRCEGQNPGSAPFRPDSEIRTMASLDVPYTKKSPKIIVVGSINIDTILSVDKVPHIGETVSTTVCSTFAGGKGANQATGVSKLGHKVSLVGKVGNDVDGAYICNCMKEYNVDISGTILDRDNVTGKAYIHVQGDGDSTISIYSGANGTISGSNIAGLEYLFENSGFCLIQTEIPMPAVCQAAELARKHGVSTVLKPSACKHLSDSLLANIDILVPNSMEMNTICPVPGDLSRQADYFLGKGVKAVITTLGGSGCYLKSADIEQNFPAADFVSVDNTGASDAFISALASYLLYGYPIEKAIKIATYAAGFSVSRQGVIPALIDKSSLEVYINSIEPELLDLPAKSVD